MSCADLSPKPTSISGGNAIRGNRVSKAPGRTSRVEVICSACATRGEFKYLLPRARKATLPRNVPEFGRQLSVMLYHLAATNLDRPSSEQRLDPDKD
jgi:hypothetical protein